jgi:hypothetical protein
MCTYMCRCTHATQLRKAFRLIIYIYRRLAAPTSSACWPNAGLAGPPECDAGFLICRSISAATRGSHPKNVFSSGYSWLILLLNHEIAATQDVLCWTVFLPSAWSIVFYLQRSCDWWSGNSVLQFTIHGDELCTLPRTTLEDCPRMAESFKPVESRTNKKTLRSLRWIGHDSLFLTWGAWRVLTVWGYYRCVYSQELSTIRKSV